MLLQNIHLVQEFLVRVLQSFQFAKEKKNAELAMDTIRKITDEKSLEYNLILSGVNKDGIKIIN